MWSATCTMNKNQTKPGTPTTKPATPTKPATTATKPAKPGTPTRYPDDDEFRDAGCRNPRYPDDDGRVVADMSQVVKVGMLDLIAPEGLRKRLGGRRPNNMTHGGHMTQDIAGSGPMPSPYGNGEPVELTEGELKALMKASLKAALLLAGVFIAAAGLFILFCIYVWFR